MGALRTVGKAAGGFFFTVFLALVIFMLVVAHFTACSTLKPIVVDLLKQQLTATPEQLSAIHEALLYQCDGNESKTVYLNITAKEYLSPELKCSDISKTAATDLPELIGNETFDKIYFKRYDCSFEQCIQLPGEERFLFLISGQANEFFEMTIIYLGVAAALSAFVLVAATETWPGRFRAVGLSLVFVGMPYFLMPLVKGYVERQLPSEISTRISPVINQMLDSISGNLLTIFIVGVVLTATGLVLGYLAKRKETKKK
jgi:hypothetical protein